MFLMPNFCISIPTLKNLKINDAVCGAQNCAFEIRAPSLLTLFYKGFVAKEYVLSSFVSLVEAVVCFCGELEARSIDGAVSQFFGALTHVKCLTVDYPARQAKNLLNRLPTYPNIKQLKITGIPNYSDVVVIALLKVTPNLESLVMEKWESAFLELPDYETDDSFDSEGEENQDNEDEGNTSEDGSDEGENNHVSIEDGWTSLLDMVATGGLFLHLKSVSFKPIIWSPREKLCVKVILRKAKALQSLTICHDYSRHPLNLTEQDLMRQIVSFPRASASCRFKICSE